MSSQLSKVFACIFRLLFPVIFVEGSTWIDIDWLMERRGNDSFFLRILTTQQMTLHVCKVGCLIVHVGTEINHTWSH